MAEIPEGATTASSEGADLVSAIEGVAKELEIAPEEVAYKLDLSHFRSGMGVSVAKRTVKIIGWKGEAAKPLPKAANASGGGKSEDRPRRDREDRPRRDREDRPRRDREDRGERRARGGDRDDRGRGERRERKARSQEPMEGEPTEASKFAVEWFSTLLGFMDVKGKVEGIGNDERVRVTIEADKAGRIIGKRGSTLRAIRTVLGSALKNKFGDLIIDVDVADNRDDSERPERRERKDRDDRGGRGRDRGGRDRGGRDRGDRGSASSAHPPAKLEALAKRAGEKAVETNKTITINLELNSYDRRIVHMAIAEIDGVDSRSEERDGKKYVQVMPAAE